MQIIFDVNDIKNLSDYNLLILHQIPYTSMVSFESLKHILDDNKKLPILTIIGKNTDYEELNKIQNAVCLKKELFSLFWKSKHATTTISLFQYRK